MAKVIGLTGPPCSGKERVKDFICELCAERGLRALHLSFSDEIKREALRRGTARPQIDRDRIVQLARRMRRAEGPGVIAGRIVRRISGEKADVYVAEAIRHPAEAEILRRAYGADFVLASVDSKIRTMARRLLSRTREDESPTARGSLRAAQDLIRRELRGDEAAGTEVGRAMETADVKIANRGTLAELRDNVRRLFQDVIPPAPAS